MGTNYGGEKFPTRKVQAKKPQKPQRQKQAKKRRRPKRYLHYILFFSVVAIVGTILSLTVFFKIEDIRVYGSDFYSAEDIIAATGISKGENLILTSTKEIPDSLTVKFPYIETAVLKKVLPPAIEIHLTDSDVSAALELGDSDYALISSGGKVLERGQVLLPADVVLVKGVDIHDKQPGDYLGEYTPKVIAPEEKKNLSEDSLKTLKAEVDSQNALMQTQALQETEALSVINYLQEAMVNTGFTGITNLDLTDPLNMTVMYENRLLLKLGTEFKLEYKLKHIQECIKRLDKDARGKISAENTGTDSQVVFTPEKDMGEEKLPTLPADKSVVQADKDKDADAAQVSA